MRVPRKSLASSSAAITMNKGRERGRTSGMLRVIDDRNEQGDEDCRSLYNGRAPTLSDTLTQQRGEVDAEGLIRWKPELA
jgi:hypothetical protein